jgi:hypothetical protein
MGRKCSMPGRHKKFIQNFGQKASKEGPLGRLRHRWDHNIKVNFKEIWCEGTAWVYLASLDEGSCKYNNKNLWSKKKVGNFLIC